MPRNTSDSAWPRRAAGTMATATLAASATNTAPAPISRRDTSSMVRPCDRAHAALPSVNSASASSSARLRGQPPVASSSSGASSAVPTA